MNATVLGAGGTARFVNAGADNVNGVAVTTRDGVVRIHGDQPWLD
jgi:hypothetical protein